MVGTPSLLFIPLEVPEDASPCLNFSISAEDESHLCEVFRHRQQVSTLLDFSVRREVLILVQLKESKIKLTKSKRTIKRPRSSKALPIQLFPAEDLFAPSASADVRAVSVSIA